jgi:hypothetical protein
MEKVSSGRWFNMLDDRTPTSAHPLRHGGDDSIMLEAVVLLLSLATCALILIAFWGLDLLRIRSSSVSSRILPTDRA